MVDAYGQCTQQTSGPSNTNLVGHAPEIECRINNISTYGLLDTGSQISSIAYNFYKENFSSYELHDVSSLLKVETVAGTNLPFHGFCEFEISFQLSEESCFKKVIPFLVVPDTNYNQKIPILIGTNVLNHVVSKLSTIPAVQMAIQSIRIHQQLLENSKGVIGEIISTNETSLPPFTGKVMFCQTKLFTPICNQLACVEALDYPVVPGLVSVKQNLDDVPVEIYNNTDSVLKIQKGIKVGSLQQACVEFQPKEDYREFLNEFDIGHLDVKEQNSLKQFLVNNRDIFAMNVDEMGCCNFTEHKIDLTDPEPFKEKQRPVPPGMYQELKNHISELLTAGVIEESHGPWSSNIVLVRKRDNSLRLCIDYRRLNKNSKIDCYNIARIEPLLDSLRGAKYFASLDMFSGYYQVKIADEHKERTAFSTPCGFFQYVKMPFGLRNAPATFQRMADKVFEGYIMSICVVYLDDIIVFSDTKEGLYENLQKVFDRLRCSNLKLKPKKCHFFKEKIEFLGHTVSSDGIECTNSHIKDVLDWQEPKSVKQLQSFLGFANFYRRFVPGFAAIAEPLTRLTKGFCHKKGKTCKNPNQVEWCWGLEQKTAFDCLKKALTNPPILAYPNFNKPFELHVDASRLGLGAVLYQEDEVGKLRVISYASRSLNKAEKNYTVHKLEFLALKWAITCKFRYYLCNNKFVVYTDHNPLVYLSTSAKLDALGHRWLSELSTYNFEIYYKPGLKNSDADGLSRKVGPDQLHSECTQHLSKEIFDELCNLLISKEYTGFYDHVKSHAVLVSSCSQESIDWSKEQDSDPVLSRVKFLLCNNIHLSASQKRVEIHGVSKLLVYRDSLCLKDGILFRKSKNALGEEVSRLVVPEHFKILVLKYVHEEVGHLGVDKTLSVAQERFFWIGLGKSVELYVKNCRRCICAKTVPHRAPLVSINTTQPFELLCLDFLGLESSGHFSNILVVTDHFTGYAWAFPTRNQEAKTVAKLLYEKIILPFGIPARIHSDQGGSFEANVIHNLCSLLGIKKSRTTPYHPMGNGKTEKMNSTLLNMLRTLSLEKKSKWKDHVTGLAHAYNACKHDSTGFSPFYLMFGRKPRLSLDIALGLPTESTSPVIKSVHESLTTAYEIVSKSFESAKAKQRKYYNMKVKGANIEIGDLVLMKNVGLKGKNKLADKWKDEVFVVISQPNPDVPVFKIRLENGKREKIVHRNLLLPLTLPLPKDRDGKSHDVKKKNAIEPIDDYVESDSDVSEIELHLPGTNDCINSNVSDVEEHLTVSSDAEVSEAEEVLSDQEVLDQTQTEVQTEPDPPPSPGPRRSSRVRRPPAYLGDYVSFGTTVHLLDWQVKVSALLQLLPLFPLHHADIANAILYVISHA